MKIEIGIPVLDSADKEKKVSADLTCTDISAKGAISIKMVDLLPYLTNKVAVDLFFISTFVYGIDRFIDRYSYSEDGWSRTLEVTFPVYELKKWQDHKEILEQMLSFLTGDYWEVNFKKNTLVFPAAIISPTMNQKFDQVSLFSGGLDSLIGAIDFLEENPNQKLLVVSHVDPHISARKEQNSLRNHLMIAYTNRFYALPSVSAGLSYSNMGKEKTFRSRSLLFISTAVLVANGNSLPILVPENGTVSLNYPLSSSRRSACSTRTTHPTFLIYVNKLLTGLGITSQVENIYDLKTKGEMVHGCRNVSLLKKIYTESISCGKRGHKANWSNMTADQCGVCMPCIYRQASLQSFPDVTGYGNSLNKKLTGRHHSTPFLLSKQGQDFAACLNSLKSKLSNEDIRNELMINGVIEIDKLDGFVSLVKRSRQELISWIKMQGDSSVKNKAGIP